MLLQQKRLRPKMKDSSNSIEYIESQLADYSRWLRQYTEPFLKGDFSQWLRIYEYKVRRARTARIRSGKDEFVLHFARLDENGKPVHEKRRVFQAALITLKSYKKSIKT